MTDTPRTSNERARPDRKLWPLTAEGDNLFNHELQMWQYEQIERLQHRVAELEAMDAAAATHVESLTCLRTHFTGAPPYVGWEGLGLALREALDERDRYKHRVSELERCQRAGWDYAREIEAEYRTRTGHGFGTPAPPDDDLMRWVETWANAYPLDIFPEPDLKRAREVLAAAGISLDCISASNMRHVITRVRDKMRGAVTKGGGQ